MAVSIVDGEEKVYKRGHTISEYTPWMKRVSSNSPILGDYTSFYVNRADVRAAMHIPTNLPGYEECSSILNYTS